MILNFKVAGDLFEKIMLTFMAKLKISYFICIYTNAHIYVYIWIYTHQHMNIYTHNI